MIVQEGLYIHVWLEIMWGVEKELTVKVMEMNIEK